MSEPPIRGVSTNGNQEDTNLMGAYGEGKTYYQEAADSRAALGLAIVISILTLLALGALCAAWIWYSP